MGPGDVASIVPAHFNSGCIAVPCLWECMKPLMKVVGKYGAPPAAFDHTQSALADFFVEPRTANTSNLNCFWDTVG